MDKEKKKEYNIKHREKKKRELEEKARAEILLKKEISENIKEQKEKMREIKAIKKQEIDEDSEDLILDKDTFDKLVEEKAKEKALFFLNNSKNKKETPKETENFAINILKSTAKNMTETLIMMSIPLLLKVGVGYFKNSSPPPMSQSQMLQNLQLQRQQQQSANQSPESGIVF